MSVINVKNRPYIYGLTGGIASGKSISAKFFIDHGVKLFDSDLYVKNLWKNNQDLINKVGTEFNIDMRLESAKKELANIIFNDGIKRAYLNSLIHPLVFKGIEEFIEEFQNEKFIIIDMPLLFESGYETKVDKTIVIYTTRNNQISRLMKRDNITKSEAIKRIDSQLDLKSKKKMGHLIVNNIGTIDNLYDRLNLLYEVMKNENGL